MTNQIISDAAQAAAGFYFGFKALYRVISAVTVLAINKARTDIETTKDFITTVENTLDSLTATIDPASGYDEQDFIPYSQILPLPQSFPALPPASDNPTSDAIDLDYWELEFTPAKAPLITPATGYFVPSPILCLPPAKEPTKATTSKKSTAPRKPRNRKATAKK